MSEVGSACNTVDTKTPSRTRHWVTPTAFRLIDEDFAGTTTGEADDPEGILTIECAFVHPYSLDTIAQHVRPPLPDAKRTDVHVVVPPFVVAWDPPVNPEVLRPKEHEPAPPPTATNRGALNLVLIEHVNRLAPTEHQRRVLGARHVHRRYIATPD